MNTGIGDAVNFGWKVADVVGGRADARLLDTYEPERIAFARRLVETTDRIFTLATSDGGLARFMRVDVVPRVVPPLFERRAMRAFLFRTVSQTAIDYRGGGLASGRAGRVAGGDRLPWTPVAAGGDNFAPLASLRWQAHVYGDAPASYVNACAQLGVPLHAFAWHDDMQRAGFARDAAYLVRPDGYVGLADAQASGGTLATYLRRHGLRDA
jgi:hypothetical protein